MWSVNGSCCWLQEEASSEGGRFQSEEIKIDVSRGRKREPAENETKGVGREGGEEGGTVVVGLCLERVFI